MNTIGQIMKDARLRKKYSLAHLEEITKIRRSFLEAIEKEKWEVLPSFSTVLGFVKSLSASLEIDANLAVAVLKRDYPPKKININPKPDVVSKFTWSPKLTFIVGIAIALAIIFGYLGFQYYRFISPPSLSVNSPRENQVVRGESVLVFGSTDSDSKITVNNQPVIVNDDGKFSLSLEVAHQTNEINIVAVSRSGKSTTVSRKITVE